MAKSAKKIRELEEMLRREKEKSDQAEEDILEAKREIKSSDVC